MSGGRSYSRVLEEMLAVHAPSLNTAFLNQAQDVYGFLRNSYITTRRSIIGNSIHYDTLYFRIHDCCFCDRDRFSVIFI